MLNTQALEIATSAHTLEIRASAGVLQAVAEDLGRRGLEPQGTLHIYGYAAWIPYILVLFAGALGVAVGFAFFSR
ncbi:MAG TPA: hypothetical protein VK524_20915 [Polyangiaceae bacterium]|nr:hypothetical protein [Polyangiaceae bacterium]